MEKHIEVTLKLDEYNWTAEFYETESGDFIRYSLENFNGDKGRFAERCGEELTSWFSLMEEEMEDEEA